MCTKMEESLNKYFSMDAKVTCVSLFAPCGSLAAWPRPSSIKCSFASRGPTNVNKAATSDLDVKR